MPIPRTAGTLLFSCLLLATCSLTDPLDPTEPDPRDAGTDDGGFGDGPRSASADGEAEDAAEPVAADPGPLTFVVEQVTVMTDRMCDLDSDGIEDNAVADLGPSMGPLFSLTLDSILAAYIEDFGGRIGIHLPWVDDRSRLDDAAATLISFEAVADESGRPLGPDGRSGPEDDFDGTQPFFADAGSVDACGEPRFVFETVHLDDGVIVSGEPGSVPLPLSMDTLVEGRGARFEGNVASDGAGMTFRVCAYGRLGELGGFSPNVAADGLSFLEVMLLGGAAWGVTIVPGLLPDVDVDGDGLERFATDELGQITACIDGDETAIEGRECWQDPRIADGLSFVIEFRAVPAVFAGLEPLLEEHPDGPCESPPEVSLWEPR